MLLVMLRLLRTIRSCGMRILFGTCACDQNPEANGAVATRFRCSCALLLVFAPYYLIIKHGM